MGSVDQPKIMTGTVMHARMKPARNAFKYRMYYIALPLSKLAECPITQERFALTSFYRKDHGARDGSPLEPWARDILTAYGVTEADGEIVLVCLPRIMGYVFNPVSFWVCYDKHNQIRAMICEVHNTFGQQHSYLCVHEDHRPIQGQDTLTAQKLFHVSPFLKTEGHYSFVFDFTDEKFSVWIDYFDAEGSKTLVTSLIGDFAPLTQSALRQSLWAYPLVTFKAILLIHWQAIKIITKNIPYVPKPKQKEPRLSKTQPIEKN